MELDRCRDLRDHHVGFVVGTLTKPLELRVEAHLSGGCGPCARRIEALQGAFQSVPLAFGPQPPLPGGAELLAKNVGATPQAERIEPIAYPETNERRLLVVLLVAFGLALAAAAFWGRTQVEQNEALTSDLAFERSRHRATVGQYRTLQTRAHRVEQLLETVLAMEPIPGTPPYSVKWGPDAVRVVDATGAVVLDEPLEMP